MPYICINNKPIPGNYNEWLDKLKEGEEYDGYINEYGIGLDCKESPVLMIPSITKEVGFDIRRFVPTSNLDETTLVNEEWEEKYCVPVNDRPCV